MKGPANAPAAVVVTPRNVEAVFGFTWPEVARLLAERGVSIRHVGRRPFVFVSDVVAALDGTRSQAWTDDDVRRSLAAGGRR